MFRREPTRIEMKLEDGDILGEYEDFQKKAVQERRKQTASIITEGVCSKGVTILKQQSLSAAADGVGQAFLHSSVSAFNLVDRNTYGADGIPMNSIANHPRLSMLPHNASHPLPNGFPNQH